VSVAFGAPVGGVLFSLEEVSYYFPHKTLWRSFYCAAIGAIVLMILNPFHTGKLVLFQVKYSHTWPLFALVPFALIGALGGVIGILFIKFNKRMCAYRRSSNLSKHPIREVACIAAVTALVSFLNPYLRGNSGLLLSTLFDDCTSSSTQDLCKYLLITISIYIFSPSKTWTTVGYLILATLIRLSLTIITFGSKVLDNLLDR
jgi:chloride channel 3/4/5